MEAEASTWTSTSTKEVNGNGGGCGKVEGDIVHVHVHVHVHVDGNEDGAADGTRVRRAISDCRLRLAGREGPVTVILGKTGDEALVGGIALECLGLMLDPFRRKLHRMRMRI